MTTWIYSADGRTLVNLDRAMSITQSDTLVSVFFAVDPDGDLMADVIVHHDGGCYCGSGSAEHFSAIGDLLRADEVDQMIREQ